MLTPFLSDADVSLYHGDALEVLRSLPSESVHCCVTSPPFYGLRDYGTGTWEGGLDPGCDHTPPKRRTRRLRQRRKARAVHDNNTNSGRSTSQAPRVPRLCGKCGAQRVDQQIGLEDTPEAWVAALVAVFREVRRVLRPDGTLWLEVGDSYASNPGSGYANGNLGGLSGRDSERYQETLKAGAATFRAPKRTGDLKPKDLIGAPWQLAFALRADGWYLRSDIVWARPNPMPESVTDRPTKPTATCFCWRSSPGISSTRKPSERHRLQLDTRTPTCIATNPSWSGNRLALRCSKRPCATRPMGKRCRPQRSVSVDHLHPAVPRSPLRHLPRSTGQTLHPGRHVGAGVLP